jgi:hypothetical protein
VIREKSNNNQRYHKNTERTLTTRTKKRYGVGKNASKKNERVKEKKTPENWPQGSALGVPLRRAIINNKHVGRQMLHNVMVTKGGLFAEERKRKKKARKKKRHRKWLWRQIFSL